MSDELSSYESTIYGERSRIQRKYDAGSDVMYLFANPTARPMRIVIFSRPVISNFSIDLIKYLMKKDMHVEGIVFETSFRKKYSHNEIVYRVNRQQFKWRTGIYTIPHYMLIRCWNILPLRIKEIISRNIHHIPILKKKCVEYKCRKIGIPIYKVEKHSTPETVKLLNSLRIDYVVLLSSNWLIKEPLLSMPNTKIINAHYGYLPRYRGLNAPEWTLAENGPLGITTHFIDAGIDTGPILGFYEVKKESGDDIHTIKKKLGETKLQAIYHTLEQLKNQTIQATPQSKVYPILNPMSLESLMQLYNALRNSSSG